MEQILEKKEIPTIDQWLEELPSKAKALKIYQLAEKCNRNISTVYKWKKGEVRPNRKLQPIIEEVAGQRINFY